MTAREGFASCHCDSAGVADTAGEEGDCRRYYSRYHHCRRRDRRCLGFERQTSSLNYATVCPGFL